jgi:hypothetical protein
MEGGLLLHRKRRFCLEDRSFEHIARIVLLYGAHQERSGFLHGGGWDPGVWATLCPFNKFSAEYVIHTKHILKTGTQRAAFFEKEKGVLTDRVPVLK